MSKFCENCVAEMDDNQVVCPNCGNGAEAQSSTVEEPIKETTTTASTSSVNKENLKKYGIIGGIALAVIVVLALLISLLSGGWKKPIDNYFKGMAKFNAKTYTKAYVKFIAKDMDLDKDDMKDMKEAFEDEYGKNVKISYKIKDKEKIDKDDLKKVQEYVEEKYDEKVKISGGYKVSVKATIKGKDKSETNTTDMYVYKVDGKWGIISEGLSPKVAKNYLKNK